MADVTAADVDASRIHLGRKAVLYGVLHQRLQDHAGHKVLERGGLEFLHHRQLVAAEARNFNVEVVVEKLKLLAQRNERVSLAQQTAQNIAEFHDHLACRVGITAHQRGNRVQRIEQEVRIDLALQGLHASLQQ